MKWHMFIRSSGLLLAAPAGRKSPENTYAKRKSARVQDARKQSPSVVEGGYGCICCSSPILTQISESKTVEKAVHANAAVGRSQRKAKTRKVKPKPSQCSSQHAGSTQHRHLSMKHYARQTAP